MLARLDNLPQHHRSVTLRTAAPDVDFRTSMRRERIPGRHDPCSRNSPSHACHAKAPAIGITLAETAETPPWAARPIPRQTRGQGGKVGNPFCGPYSGTQVFLEGHWEEKWHDRRPARQLVGSLAGQRELADVGSMVPTYSRRPWRSPAAIRKFPIVSMRESRKPPAMVLTYSGLLRPKF
jgi:hypothetical protein